MNICYLNQTARSGSGAGNFYHSLSAAVKKVAPDAESEVLASENLLFPNKFKLFFALPAIRKVLKNCDLIHTLDAWPYGVIATLANIGVNKPLIITAIGTGAVKPLYHPLKRRFLSWAYRRADRVVAVSNNTKLEILKFLPDLKIDVINHGVDARKFQAPIRPSEKFQKLKPYILSVGAWKPRKGFDYSLEAFNLIKEKFPDLKYVIVSNPPEEIKKKHERVIFFNNLAERDLIDLYKNAELFILLPQDDQKDIEGFGLAFLEAAAAGLPVIATRGTSAEEVVREGKSGVLVPPHDYREAASAISALLTDEKTRVLFSKEAINVANLMSWGKAARAYLDLYQAMVRLNPSSKSTSGL